MIKQAAIALIFAIGLTVNSYGQTENPEAAMVPVAPISPVAEKALEYFNRIKLQKPSDFLRRIRPLKISPALKYKALSLIPKEDLVIPSAGSQAKLNALAPILEYHERDSFIELKILRVRQATTAFLAGSAVIITEPALELLTPEELQAIVAHELGHEYFWNEYELARQHQQNQVMQELELRSDGISVITLLNMGLDPENLISAIDKLTRYNERKGVRTASNQYVSLNERFNFIRSLSVKITALRACAGESRPVPNIGQTRREDSAQPSTDLARLCCKN